MEIKKKQIKSAGYDCVEIASIIFHKLKKIKISSPLRVQKFLWYTQIRYYALTNELLFVDQFESWKYGPVLRKVWEKSPYENIEEKILEKKEYTKIQEIIDYIIDLKKNLFFFALVEETHEQQPYRNAISSNENDNIIKNEWISKYATDINEKYLEN